MPFFAQPEARVLDPVVVIALCTLGIVCLTPLTGYLLWLAAVNRRDRPTVVSGTWDFVALLCGLSGFLLGTALVLAGATSDLSPFAPGGFAGLWAARLSNELTRLAAVGGFVLLIAAASWKTFGKRRNALVVFNADLADADAVLESALNAMGVDATRFGNQWSAGKPVARVVPFHAFRNLSVHLLSADPASVEELDRLVRAGFARRLTGVNPLGSWVSTAALSAAVSVACCVALSLLVSYRR